MKKILFTLSVVLLAACAKEENTSINADKTPAGELVEVTFMADVPTKTSVSIDQASGKATVTWDEGDQIAIHYWDGTAQASVNAVAEQVDGKSALFVVALPKGVTDFWAVSPASTAVSLTYDATAGYSFQVTIPNTSDGSFEQANIIAAKAVAQTDDTYNLAFKNVSSILRFERGESVPTSIAFRNVSGAKVYGQVNVSFNAGGSLEACAYVSGGSGSTSLSNMVTSEDGAYYIPLLPDVDMPDGFVIKMDTATDTDIPGALCYADGARTIARGQILDIGTFEDKIVYDYYYTTETFAQAKEFLTPSIWKTRLLDGATVHFAGGTYKFDEAWALDFNTDGGAPKVVFQGEETTVFDGGGSVGLFTLAKESKATFRNITFQNGNAANGGVANISKGNWTFDNCTFTSNTATTNGGACNITGGSVKFTGCTFSSNTANAGGVIYANSVTDVLFEDSTFSSNTGINGSTIALNTATLKFNSCAFLKNSSSSGNGAVIYATVKPVVYLNSCYFEENTKKGAGGICVQFVVSANDWDAKVPKLGMNNVTIVDNTGSTQTNSALIDCKGCFVISNSTLWIKTSKYGCSGLGSINTAVKGAVIVNNVLCNEATTLPGVGTNQKYNLRSAYNIISKVMALGTGNTLASYDTQNCVTGMFNNGEPFTLTEITDVTGKRKLYTWDGTLAKCTDELTGTLTNPTLAQVEAEILKAEGIGEDFLTWLKSIKTANGKTALEVDIRGVGRNTDAMWPGAYQAE